MELAILLKTDLLALLFHLFLYGLPEKYHVYHAEEYVLLHEKT